MLIIDDSRPWRLITQRLMTGQGYTVFTAEDGQEGLDILDREKLDLVLLDVVLPDMDGFEICRVIRENPKTANLSVIMLSGVQITPDIKAKGLDTGADEYIIKPVSNRELLARIQARLRLRNALNEVSTQRHWLSTALDSITDAVLTLDAQDRILTINQAAKTLLGLDEISQVVGGSTAKALHLLDPQTGPIKLNTLIDGLRTDTFTLPDCLLMTQQGEQRPVRVRLSPMLSPSDGKNIGTVITLLNIWEEQLLRRQQALAFQLMDEMNQAVDHQHALQIALEQICIAHGWSYGEAWIPVSNLDFQHKRRSLGPGEAAPDLPRDLAADKAGQRITQLHQSCVWQENPEETRNLADYGTNLILAIDNETHRDVIQERKVKWIDLADPGQDGGKGAPPVQPRYRSGSTISFDSYLATAGAVGDLSSLLCIPLAAGGELLGLLLCFDTHPVSEDNRLAESLKVIASQATEGILRQKALDEIAVNERKLLGVLEQSYDGISMVNSAGVIITWSPAQERITGIPSQEAIGQTIWDVQFRLSPMLERVEEIRAKHRQQVQESIQAILGNKTVQVGERAIQSVDGADRTIQSAIFPILVGQESILVSISRDITLMRQAQETLQEMNVDLERRVRERTVQLEVLFELANNLSFAPNFSEVARLTLASTGTAIQYDLAAVLFIIDESSVFIVQERSPVSESALSVLKSQTQRTLYSLLSDEIHAVDPPLQIIQSKDFRDDKPVVTNLGSTIQLPLIVGGKPIGLILIATETEDSFGELQVRLLAAVASQLATAIMGLRRSQEAEADRLSVLLQNLPEGLIVLSQTRRILLLNQAAEEMLPLLTDSGVNQKLTHLGDLHYTQFLQERKSSEHEEPAFEIAVEDPLRIFKLTRSRLSHLDQPDGKQGRWLLTLQDITREKEQQRQLQAQERLATVGQLAAGIAHDFNNIMAVITLYSQMLLKNPEHPKRTAYLSTIDNQASHAAKLISQILDFSRKAVMRRQRFAIAPFIEETVAMLARTLPAHIRVTYTSDDQNLIVNGDPTRLQQMLLNLAFNARDAMPDGGTLTIESSIFIIFPDQPKPIGTMEDGIWVRIRVRDVGIGMSSEILNRAFEPFFTTKPVGQGTGLGLAQTFGIVKQHGGEIELHSRLNQGTTFTIYLPAVQFSAAQDEPTIELNDLTGGKEGILVIEDNEVARLAIEDILTNLGYEVITAINGNIALDLYAKHKNRIDLVVSDMVMPVMGGLEVFDQLKKQNPAIKFVIATGYPMKDNGRALIERGIVAWIQKPFSMDELSQLVREALDRRS